MLSADSCAALPLCLMIENKKGTCPKALKHLESRIALTHEAGDEGGTVIDAHICNLQVLATQLIVENSLGGLLGNIAYEVTSGEEVLSALILAELNLVANLSRVATVLGNNLSGHNL